MTKSDKRELELWREVGYFATDHSQYCECERCDLRRELMNLTNNRGKNERKKKGAKKNG